MTVISAVDDEADDSKVVSVGHDLATAFGDDLVVIHVMTDDTYEDRTESSPNYYRDSAAKDAKSVAQRLISSTLGEGTATNITARGRVGSPVEELLAEVNRQDARYLVVGGRKRTPVGKAVFGSNTQSVLLNAEVPVMTVMNQ
ncbi:universal stress protein [Halorarum salinum]|uniref:Universal stress protein n=1 Tax=Halorarum salinum TaxID=2743089 RepID=A0A7D5L8L4_9EURY|nr:universal stress protein [Halobaculum salinum]QLG60315.1 universal stress protein [Halobaculum salinum]